MNRESDKLRTADHRYEYKYRGVRAMIERNCQCSVRHLGDARIGKGHTILALRPI
jgi:hypothetical protein